MIDYNLIDNIEVDGIDTNDYPDFSDAYIANADYDGEPMTELMLEEINEDYGFIHDCVYTQLF